MTDSDRTEVALVTGGATGVGEALARQLADRGAVVVVVDIDAPAAEMLAADLGGSSECFDVSDRSAWTAAVSRVVERHGRLDTVALNAGIMSRPKGTPMAGDDPLHWLAERYDLLRGVNVDGVVYGVLACVPALRDSGGGRIAVTSSMAGLMPQAEDPAYSLSKHGLIGFVRSLGPTLALHGISIGAVCPAGVDTSLVPPDYREAGYSFAPPSHVASSLVEVLDKPIEETGGIWVTMGVDNPIWRYEFAPLR